MRDTLSLKAGTPRFIVIADGKVFRQGFGIGGWNRTVHPMLGDYAERKGKTGG